MSAQLTVVDRRATPAAEFRDQFQRLEGQIAMALPPHIPKDRFIRVVQTAVQSNPKLLDAYRPSLFEAAMKAAQDGLLPDGRDGAFVIFNSKIKVKDDNGNERDKWIDKVQWMPMIGGILKKVRNSGELKSIRAHVAYENDTFRYVLGDEEKIEHQPFLEGDRGKPRLVYAIAETKDGGIYREIMTLADVEKVRAVSRAKNSGPWVDWWDEMARKTVLRRLAKRLPMSSDLDDLIRRDDALYDFEGAREERRIEGKRAPLSERLASIAGPSREADDIGPQEIAGEEDQRPAEEIAAAKTAEAPGAEAEKPTQPDETISPERQAMLDLGMEAADLGEKRLKLWLGKLSAENRALLTEHDVTGLQQRAKRAAQQEG